MKRIQVKQKAWGVLWYDLKGNASVFPVYTEKPTEKFIKEAVIPVTITFEVPKKPKK